MAAGSAKTAILPVMKLEGRAARCDAERPQEILGLQFPGAEPSCTGLMWVEQAQTHARDLARMALLLGGGFFIQVRSQKQTNKTKQKMLQKNPGPTFSLIVFLIRLVA